MAGYIKKNNEFIPLTGDGYGLPLGTIIAVYSNIVPDGFLPCNGATFDTTTYAALYAYLGSDTLPDLRECTLVGIGQSDNDYDASTNPNGIHAHDVYTVGQFKDDQFQGHWHGKGTWVNTVGWVDGDGYIKTTANGSSRPGQNGYSTDNEGTPRHGTTTHGKQVGVNYCIKATPAYVEPDTVSDMVHTMRVQDSYSTEEVNTGKKWIDGKPIYRKVYTNLTQLITGYVNLTLIGDIDKIIDKFYVSNGVINASTLQTGENNGYIQVSHTGSATISITAIVLEYTKTTD